MLVNENPRNYNSILEIPVNTQYWFVRADGGKYYDDFLENGYIGISDNEISKDVLDKYEEKDGFKDIDSVEKIKAVYAHYIPSYSKQQNTLYSKRLYNFMLGINNSDIVIVPSKSSESFIIGIVTSDLFDYDVDKNIVKSASVNYNLCPYVKRREVTWIKEIARKELPEKMYWVLSAHQSFFNLNSYATEIDRLFAPIYIKGNEIFSILHVGSENDITFDNWYALQTELKRISGSKSKEFSMKPDVQSPGEIIINTIMPNKDTMVEIFNSLVGVVTEHGVLTGAGTITAFHLIFGKDMLKTGMIDYFFGEKKLERQYKKEEIREKKIQNDSNEQKLKESQNIDILAMEITPNDPGKVIPMKKKRDTNN